ncbi:MAG: DUF4349 domain-containing protein [Clostridiales bacterium]|nr:DUF4349 domain-containing protein [Clostridiales bacterium]
MKNSGTKTNSLRSRIRVRAVITMLSAVLLCAGVLSGCGFAGKRTFNTGGYSSEEYGNSISASEDRVYDSAGMAFGAMSMKETAAAEAAEYDEGGTSYQVTEDAALSVTSGNEDASEVGEISGKLIRRVNVGMNTDRYNDLIALVREKTSALGGYIENSDEYSNSDSRRNMYMLIRIPKDRLDEFLDSALTAGVVTSRSENVEDVTLTYSDLEARLRTLRTEQEKLFELMEKAEDVESIIAIESRLSEISYEIESNASRLRIYDNRISYSTVELRINEVSYAGVDEKAGLGERIIAGIEENLVDMTAFIGSLLFSLVINLPSIALLAAIAALVVLIVKRIKRRRAAKKSTERSVDDRANVTKNNSSDDPANDPKK